MNSVNDSKFKNILIEAEKSGFSVQCIRSLDFTDFIGHQKDFEVVKILANDDSEELLSIACHSFSHGGNNDLFEAWSKEQRSQGEEPDGFLSERQVIRKIQKLNRRLSNN